MPNPHSRSRACPPMLFLALLVTVYALIPSASPAQQLLGSIEGTVTDQSGAAIPNVKVDAVNLDTNLSLSVTTSNAGFYRLWNLPIGRYWVTFSKNTFKTEVHSPVQVQANRTTTES